jgi:translation initiation factor 5A
MPEDIMYSSMKDIKPGKYLLIDGIPCKVVELDFSSPGKHGAAKVRITAVGVFDNQKRTMLATSHADVEVPIITKKKAQIVSLTDTTVQLMDLENYDTFEVTIPEDLKGSLKAGAEVEILESMGKRAISRVVGGA